MNVIKKNLFSIIILITFVSYFFYTNNIKKTLQITTENTEVETQDDNKVVKTEVEEQDDEAENTEVEEQDDNKVVKTEVEEQDDNKVVKTEVEEQDDNKVVKTEVEEQDDNKVVKTEVEEQDDNKVVKTEVEEQDDNKVVKTENTKAIPTQITPVVLPTVPTSRKVLISKYKNGMYTGDIIDAYYGDMQVQVVIVNGYIATVNVLQYPSDHRTSLRINNRALPILKQETLTAQSSEINAVSGASYSSPAFKESLTTALAQAKI